MTPDLSQEGSGALAEHGSQSRSASGPRVRNNEKLCVNAAGEKHGLGSLIMGSVCDPGHSEQNSGADPQRSGCSLAQGPGMGIYVLRALTTEGAEPISRAAMSICEPLGLGPLCLEGNFRRRTLREEGELIIMISALLVIHESFRGRL